MKAAQSRRIRALTTPALEKPSSREVESSSTAVGFSSMEVGLSSREVGFLSTTLPSEGHVTPA